VEKGKAALVADDGLPGLVKGEVLPGRWYEETLEPATPGARVVARLASGAPAAVASSFGTGKALMLGSYVCAGYVSQPSETGRRFFESLLDWAGVRRPVTVSGDPVEVRLLESGRERLAFVFNHAATPAAASVTLRVPLDSRVVEEIAQGESVTTKASADGLEWKGTIPARDVRVLLLRPR